MFGSGTFGSILFGSQSTGNEMTFTPISKNTTYQKIIDLVKLQAKTIGDTKFNDTFLIELISIATQKIAKALPELQHYYSYNYTGLTITGSANPYLVDLSAINPYLEKPIQFVYIQTDGTRTILNDLTAREAEHLSRLAQYTSTVLGSYQGDKLELFAGSSFTITTATDTVTFKFIRQTISSGVTVASNIDLPDSLIQTLVTEVVTELVKYK